jgi:hypothetical protein
VYRRHPTCSAHVKEILGLIAEIPCATRREGAEWYWREHGDLVALSRQVQKPVRIVSAALAVLSPRCRWPHAKAALALVLAGQRPAGIFAKNFGKARAILSMDGTFPIDPVTAPKTWAFWRNLWRPDDPEPVTLDAWMFRAHGLPPEGGIRAYRALAEAYRAVARDIGIVPNQLQATIWLYTKARQECRAPKRQGATCA